MAQRNVCAYNCAMNERDRAHGRRITLLTSGNMTKGIFSIALPIILANSLVVVMELANAFFLGRVGSSALAAVTMAGAVVFFVSTFSSGLSIGTVALVARAYGERNYQKAEHIGTQSIKLGFALAIVIGSAGFLLASPMLRFMGAEGEILAMGTTYLKILFAGLFVMFFTFQVMGIFQGAGDTVTSMKIGALSMVINIALDPILIFGLLGAPRLGVTGAAISSLVARGIGAILLARIILRGRHAVRLRLDDTGFDFSVIRRVLYVGLPGALQMMIRSSSFVVMAGLAAIFGPKVVAALGVGNRLFGMFLLPGFGFGAAASTLVGQNLGARKPDRAMKSALMIVGFYLSLIVIFAVPMFLFSRHVAMAFSREKDTIELLSEFIKFLTVGALFMSPGMIFSQALQGAGATIYPMVAVAVSLYGIQIPLAWLLSVRLGLGAHGLWIANLASGIANAIIMSIIFLSGRWKRHRVD